MACLRANHSNVNIFDARFAKLDDDRRLAFGWAYVADDDGNVVIDHSGDFVDKIALPTLEDSVYEYVLKSREADEMHQTFTGIAQIVESVMLTPDKLQAMGLKGGRTGWWVGFKIQNDAVWEKVKNGTYSAFSIRGRGRTETIV